MRIYTILLRAVCVGIVFLLLCPGRGYAHHSFAMFDNEHHVRLQGVVTHYQWTNPHVYIEIEVRQEDGSAKRWTIECANPGILSRNGWKHNMVQEGDEGTVGVAPLRNGKAGALLKQIKLPDGTRIENGGPAGPPKISIDTGEALE